MTLEHCQICGRPVTVDCPGCGALGYCSQKHLERHRRLGHFEECSRMRAQVARTQASAL